MQTITTVALLAIVGLYFIGPVFWAIATNPPSDEAAIRARYEGLQGAVGRMRKWSASTARASGGEVDMGRCFGGTKS